MAARQQRTSSLAFSFNIKTSFVQGALLFEMLLALTLLVCSLASGVVCVCLQQEIYVPSYMWPCSGTSDCAWDVWKAEATLVIINPNSGPGTTSYPEFVNLVNTVKTGTSKVKIVLGYVLTNYGIRAPSLVLEDIDTYYSFYNVDGIFLDEGSDSCDSTIVGYYQSYDTRVKSKPGLGYTVLNWGAPGNECYLTSTSINNYVTFEGNFTDYSGAPAPPAWVNSYNSSRFWNILHTAPNDAASVTAAVAMAKSRNVGQIYITDDVLINPYNTTPSSTVWTAEVNEAKSCKAAPDPSARCRQNSGAGSGHGRKCRFNNEVLRASSIHPAVVKLE